MCQQVVVDGFYQNNATGIQSLRTFFRRDDSTNPVMPGIELGGGQVRSDGSDRICPERRTRVSVTPRKTGRTVLMAVGLNRTHATRQAHICWDVHVELGIGWTRDRM